MKFPCTIHQEATGEWSVHCSGEDVGDVSAHADTREAAVEKIKGELRYRLELCPCSGESYQHIDVEIVER